MADVRDMFQTADRGLGEAQVDLIDASSSLHRLALGEPSKKLLAEIEDLYERIGISICVFQEALI